MKNDERLQQIYAKALENSIGENKKCFYEKQIKKYPQKILLYTLILTLASSFLVGCRSEIAVNNEDIIESTINEEKVETVDKDELVNSEIEDTTNDNEFSSMQIFLYGKARTIELLEKYNFTDYTQNSKKRHYNYTYVDYKNISELDESYLYGFYVIATRETLNEVCKALGYSDIETYLISKGYVDSNGEPNTTIWYQNYVQDIVEIMRQEKEKLNKGAR